MYIYVDTALCLREFGSSHGLCSRELPYMDTGLTDHRYLQISIKKTRPADLVMPDPFGSIWTKLDNIGTFCSILDKFVQIWNHSGPIWTILDPI